MSELQQSRPQLHQDILYIIAEKLLALQPVGPYFYRIDFREQNYYTNFMFLNKLTAWTIISQFAKFKKIVFTKWTFGKEEQIRFYKNDSFDDLQSEEFDGPYIVPPGMLEYIIANGKLRVTNINSYNFLPDGHSIDIKELGEMNSLKAFCVLFLGKQVQIPDGLNNSLMVKKFRVEESIESIENNLETILAIDAVELEIFNQIENIIIDCSQFKSPIIAQNTTKITVRCPFDFDSSKEELNKFATNFETFCSLFVRVCPALKHLQFNIRLSTEYIDSSMDEFTNNLYSTIKAMEAGIKSIDIGNEHLQISIELVADLDPEFYDCLNKLTAWTIISQFAKFKQIDFTKMGEEKIAFYKNDSFDDPQSEEFGGPYIVPPGMLEYIIEKGKLRVDTIVMRYFLPDDHSIDIKELGEMNSFKAFCALFLGKQIQIPDGLNNNFTFKKFQVEDSVMSLQNNLETILAIDAVELEMEIANYNANFIIDCSQYKSPIIANNTTKITIDCRFNFKSSKEELNKFATNFETFCSFLIRVCTNLNNLQFKIYDYFIKYSIDESTDNFHYIIKSMESGIKSINIGNEHLEISIELDTDFPTRIFNKIPIQSHDLFKFGTPFTVENADARYMARSLDCIDVRGRTHKLQFKFIEDIVW